MGSMAAKGGGSSSVIAATVLRLLFCWASRVLGCSVGLLFACLSPRITQGVTESAQPSPDTQGTVW